MTGLRLLSLIRLLRAFVLVAAAWLVAGAPASLAAPTPGTWLRSARPGGAPRLTVAFVTGEDAGGAPEFLSFDGAAFGALGLFAAVDVRNLRLTYLLNRSNPRLKASGDRSALSNVLSLTGADLVVSAKQGKPWTIHERRHDAVVAVATAPAPARSDVATLHAWLRRTLGWDGLVVARSGDRILALVSHVAPGAKPQALLVRDSATRVQVVPGARAPGAVLELEALEGTVAVFRVVLGPKGEIAAPAGAKLLLEPIGED